MNKFFFLLATLFILACNNTDTKDQASTETTALTDQLIGEWNNISMRIETNSKNNTDSNEIFAVEPGQWEQRLKIKPIRTFFNKDSTWHSAHYKLNDSLFYDPSGKWWILGDSLVMAQILPSPDTTIYLLSIKNDTVSFDGLLDWDMDGKKDDRYFGRQFKKLN